ncbi:hypothetical protein Patl1_34795 [Pistacia atlantica]|uniref:Uncharacterized protein n=1 Tax=Pistacia atlantica TaxID=434234 RepID=A0ACC0ZRK8_9ROSI|nr:hypothetical protein Patl1_34795 [Pistacia atlantica]
MEGLNKDFKKMLSEHAEFKALSLKDIYTASDRTKKIRTLHYIENLLIDFETVIIPCDRGRTTVCVSSQHLHSSEVGSISNVVFVGMGEPLLNVGNVIKASDIMVHEQGLHFSPRKVIVSTSQKLDRANYQKYKLGLLLETLQEELRFKHDYKVLLEYVMLDRSSKTGCKGKGNNPSGPSQWRYPALLSPVFCPSFTANPYLVARPAQHTTKPETDSSISESIQAAPSPAPPVQTAPFPPKTQIFCPISQTAVAWTVHFHP